MTKQDKLNLARFGCSFKEREGVFCIDWRGKNLRRGSKADIYASLGTLETEAGPLVLLAFEISLVRPLPHYCYFPFDLRNPAGRKFLSKLTQTGEIKLCFLASGQTVERTHQLTPYLRSRATELYAEALQNFEKHGRSAYDFEGAVQVLERWVRIPQFLEHFFSPDDLVELSRRIGEAVQLVPKERRETARRMVREAVDAFKAYYENNRKVMQQNFRQARLGLLLLLDLHRVFVGNSEGFAEFLADGIAGSFSSEDLESLEALLKILVSLPTLPFRSRAGPELQSETKVPRVPAGLTDFVRSMAGRKFSLESIRKFLELIGLEVGGRPGRPPKDYSREYELKASGRSWTEVARCALQERPELQTEFGQQDYDSLDFEQQETLKHRIREGVKSYAERTGKPLPPRPEAVQPAVSERVQKNQKNSAMQKIPPDKLPS